MDEFLEKIYLINIFDVLNTGKIWKFVIELVFFFLNKGLG